MLFTERFLSVASHDMRKASFQTACLLLWASLAAGNSEAIDLAGGQNLEAAREFWSLRPLQKSEAPAVKDEAWCRTEVDQFIRHGQEAKKIQPNSLASPRTLLRRAYFDLTGLPPSEENTADFMEAAAKDFDKAYENLLDELLASPRYGERWARHWLDLVRFAESNGYAFDKDRKNAFRYRDFVIQALNDDMPYDEFTRLQVAGDLLRPKDLQAVAATGFLVAGPFTTQQTQKERERSRYEQLDDMVHVMGTSMLGITIGCARCHEHKYDPVSQEDYYRLVANFAEVGFSDVGIDAKPWIYEAAKKKFDAEHAPLQAALSKYDKEELPSALETWLANKPDQLPTPEMEDWHVIGPFAGESFDKAFDKAFGPEREKSIDLNKTYGKDDKKVAWKAQPEWVDGTVHNPFSAGNSAHYLYRLVKSPVARKLSVSLGSDDGFRFWLNRKEIKKNKIGRGAAPDQEKFDLSLVAGDNHLIFKIVNGGGPSGFYFKTSVQAPPKEVLATFDKPSAEWSDKERAKAQEWYRTIDEGWLERKAAVQEHKQKEPKPDLTMVYAAKVRGSTYNFGKETYNVYFLNRGNADQKGDLQKPGFLPALMREGRKDDYWTNRKAEGDKPVPGRIALADWLTDSSEGAGMLLARVMANRLWLHHFGRGIVATPSDFGTRGEAPTHPELLDFLAHSLIDSGWKLKSLHKLIMTSSVYMQAGGQTATGSMQDPANLLWWRKDSRRLEAEAFRDALLAVSGTLDTTPFGPGTLDERKPRRSIYLTVKRSNLSPLLQLFDAPDTLQGIGNRQESTVAPQALALINSPILIDLAQKFATRVRKDPAKVSLQEGIRQAYRVALSRDPGEEELAGWVSFVEQQKALHGNNEQLAFRDVCHAILCANEFAYID